MNFKNPHPDHPHLIISINMKTINLQDSVKVINGEKILFYENYKFSMKTSYPYGEEKWGCVCKHCRSVLYLVENRDDEENDGKKTHVILTFKSTMGHNHTVDGKRNGTGRQRKREIKENDQQHPKITKIDLVNLYPSLTIKKNVTLEKPNLEKGHNLRKSIEKSTETRGCNVQEPVDDTRQEKSSGGSNRRKTSNNQKMGLREKNWLLSERLSANKMITGQKLIEETPLPIRIEDPSIRYQHPGAVEKNNQYNFIYRNNYRDNPRFVNDITSKRLPIKDLYCYNVKRPGRFPYCGSYRSNIHDYPYNMIVPQILPLPVEIINLENYNDEPIDLSIIKVD